MLVNYYKGYTTGEFLDYYNKCMEIYGYFFILLLSKTC